MSYSNYRTDDMFLSDEEGDISDDEPSLTEHSDQSTNILNIHNDKGMNRNHLHVFPFECQEFKEVLFKALQQLLRMYKSYDIAVAFKYFLVDIDICLF